MVMENDLNLEEYINKNIIYQKMRWLCGDHKDNIIVPKLESLDEMRGESPLQSPHKLP